MIQSTLFRRKDYITDFKVIIVIIIAVVGLISCDSKGVSKNTTTQKYLNIVDNIDGYRVAYSDDSHTMIYKQDSLGNYIVYYAHLDDRLAKKGYERIRDEVVRIEIDSSLKTLISFFTIHGGAFCKTNNNLEYDLIIFDDSMNEYSLKRVETSLHSTMKEIKGKEDEIKEIIILLNRVYEMALSVDNYNISGWNYIVTALEPSQRIVSYDVMTNDTIYDLYVKNRIRKVAGTTEGLTKCYYMLKKK